MKASNAGALCAHQLRNARARTLQRESAQLPPRDVWFVVVGDGHLREKDPQILPRKSPPPDHGHVWAKYFASSQAANRNGSSYPSRTIAARASQSTSDW